MEECLLSHSSLAEAIVVGLNDDLKGQIPFGIVIIKDGVAFDKQTLFKELIQIVRNQIGPIACLTNFAIVDKLPKTRSGKLLRGTVRKILQGQEYVFPQTIDDPKTIEKIHEIFNQDPYFQSQKEKIFGLKIDSLEDTNI